ncbi:MAG: ABC transporter ATP-binding protein [Verrucomicrobia bacterium CG_4_10_14_3_um_filter_43_23]|nr:MAG: ABC transporter ATP-binding protein [Verrucomicrobia bacterium CG1_02_43_26]PIP58579.1 MAG: ABC transporter ATP-binding protein [Verrucomicrobia bacterium CG22_combo_CG10-13_8_21_14_all_43_17]PIX58794.1 MAG: ABC transporter ATP-binding protein [Verrucomicrobia bacterium CG_4_10_14_3_um_filter_43_23]PIY60806.1 MAG: ABC transporter ATP-binding protein [Verrucomicrobia bacterium CG_4_10_14_0_8_um_filter_43_34]PJA43945.1 MAG: ABC transporter ATP-binding protein [Verrucomicrobia bacterium CG
MLEIHDIHVTLNERTPIQKKILNGITLTVNPNEAIAVIGANGSGKTTFMNAIAGEVKIKSGSIKIDKKNVTKWDTQQRSASVARVFQDPLAGTCGELTIEENLALAYNRGKPRNFLPAITKSMRELFKESLSELKMGLEKRLKDPMELLSGGQRQAISLVMATLQPSQILLLDEPTAALDPKISTKVLNLADKLIEKYSLTTLMITHSMQQALTFGSRTIVLSQGKIIRSILAEERSNMTVADLMAIFEE